MDVSHLFLAEASSTDNLMSKLAMTAGGAASGSSTATMMQNSSSDDPSVLLVGGGVVVAALVVALVASKSGGDGGDDRASSQADEIIEPEPEPIDVSIPYDAAILLAYQRAIGGGTKLDDDDGPEKVMKSPSYQTFKKLYLEQSVLEITLKQKNKQMNSFVESLV